MGMRVNKNGSLGVSAVIPAYNSARFIQETIKSLMGQTCNFSEIIVVDDSSNDDTYSIAIQLAQLSNGMVRVYRLSQNYGPSTARNFGTELAKGEWVLFMDSDDIAEPQLLEQLCQRLHQLEKENPAQWILAHCAYIQIGENGEIIPGIHRWKQVEPEEILGYEFVRNHIIATSGVLVNRDITLKAGGFPTNIRYSEDWDLWLRLAQLGGFAYMDEPLVKIRRHATNTSKNIKDMLEGEKKILNNYSISFIEEAIQRRHLPWEINKTDFVSILYRLGYWEDGFEVIKEVTLRTPDLPVGFFLLGLYYLHKHQWNSAQNAFEDTLKLASGHGAALNNLSAILALKGLTDKASDLLNKALLLFPGYLDAKYNLKLIEERKTIDSSKVRFTWRELRPVLLSYSNRNDN